MRSILMSIRPQWCDLIFSEEKTVEVRKSKPKLETPFKCYVYCTASEESLFEVTTNKELHDGFGIDGEVEDPDKKIFIKIPKRNSWNKIFDYKKVIGEFTVERFIDIRVADKTYGEHYTVHDNDIAIEDAQCQPNLRTCMTLYELIRYLKTAMDKHGYGWVISNPVLYKESMDLTDFCVKRPPQSWQYIESESVKCENCPTQSDSGDPSSENIRPISGFAEINVGHSGADTIDQTVYKVSLGEVGKVYYGTLDVTTDTLTIDD